MALSIACIGFIFLFRGWRRSGITAISASGFLVVLSSTAFFADTFIDSLESQYPALMEVSDVNVEASMHIVVLGSGYQPDERLPITSTLGETGMLRLIEGVRLYRLLPGRRLILTGGVEPGKPAAADGYFIAATTLGVPEQAILRIPEPTTTVQEIEAIETLIGTSPVVLVTSAFHMPRAIALSRRAGVNVIPAPTGHLVSRSNRRRAASLIPSGDSLRKTELALHEYLGLLALRVGLT